MQRVTQMVTMVVALCTITQAQFTTEHRAHQETKSVRSFEQDRTQEFVPSKSRGMYTEKLDSVLYLDPTNPTIIKNKYLYTYDASGRELTESKYSSNTGWSKKEYSYSSNGMISTQSKYDSLQDAWIVGIKTEEQYDSLGNNISTKGFDWKNDMWVIQDEYTRTFNEFGLLLSEIRIDWWSSTSWDYRLMTENTYDASGNEILSTIFDWHGIWEESSKKESIYDSQGNRLSYTAFNKRGSIWVPNYRYDNTYTTTNRILSETYYDWDTVSADWITIDSAVYTYDSQDNRTGAHVQEWFEGAWRESSKSIITIDGSIPFSSITMGGTWRADFMKYLQAYSKVTDYVYFEWDWTLDQWVLDTHPLFFYSSLTSPNAPQIKGSTSPFSATVVGNKIRFSSPLPAGAQVQIHTLAGRTIHTASVVGTSYNLPPLSSGVYFVTVKAQQQKHQFKMSVQ